MRNSVHQPIAGTGSRTTRTRSANETDMSEQQVQTLIEAEHEDAMIQRARARVAALKDTLKARFFERDDVIDGMAAAIVAREHVLVIGEPGTAKSELANAFCEALDGRFFSTLCTRFQPPEEVLGMLSLKGLQEDRYVRRTSNRLPEADVAFLDEVFKGSSALLNTLLRILNERSFEQDGVTQTIPLRLVVAASNELPDESDGLGAFHDRFLLRFDVRRLQSDENARAMIFQRRHFGGLPKVEHADLDRLSMSADAVVFTGDAEDAVLQVRTKLHEAGVRVSDRRWRKAAGLMRADAAISGRARATSANLGILEHCLWEKPEQIAKVREIVRAHVASWIKATREAHAALDEQTSRAQDAAAKGGRRAESIGQLAKVLDALIDVDSAMDDLMKSTPEASDEVEKVRARIVKIKGAVMAGMRTHGIGA